MIVKKTLPQIQSKIVNLKRMYINKQQFLVNLWNSGPRSSKTNAYLTLSEMISHALSRNVKPYEASTVKKYDDGQMHLNAENGPISMKKFLLFVLSKPKPDHHSSVSNKVMNFQFRQALLQKCFLKLCKNLLSLKKQAIPQENQEKQWGGSEAYKLIVFITNNFNEVIKKHRSVLVFFSAEWCQHCMRLRAPFGHAAVMAKEANLPVVFATFDVTSNPNIADENGIVGIPTIKFYENGKIISTFRGKRTTTELLAYVKNPYSSQNESKKADV